MDRDNHYNAYFGLNALKIYRLQTFSTVQQLFLASEQDENSLHELRCSFCILYLLAGPYKPWVVLPNVKNQLPRNTIVLGLFDSKTMQ